MESNIVQPTTPGVDIFEQVQSHIDQKKVPEAVKDLDSWLYEEKNITQEEADKVHQCVQNILSALTSQASEIGKLHAEVLKGLHPTDDASKIYAAQAALTQQQADVQELVSNATKIDSTASKLLNQAKTIAAKEIEDLATELTQLLTQKNRTGQENADPFQDVRKAVKTLDTWLYGKEKITQKEADIVHQCVQTILSALTSQASEVPERYAKKWADRFDEAARMVEDNPGMREVVPDPMSFYAIVLVRRAEAAYTQQQADVQELVSNATKIDITASKLLNKKVQAKAPAAKEKEDSQIENLATELTRLLTQEDRNNEPLKKFLQEQSKNLYKIVPLVLSRLLPDAARIRLETLLHELYPQSEEYFYFEQGLVYTQPKGMELVVSYLQKKEALSLPCEVYDVSHLSKKLIQLAQQNDNAIRTFITKRDGESLHWAPVMFYRSDDQKEFRMVVTDGAYSLTTGFRAALWLNQDFKELAAQINSETGKPCRLLVFNEFRQRDESNCSIFSLHDVIRYSKNTELIKKYCENLIQVARGIPLKDNVRLMTTLPHYGFMRSAQSIEQIEKHLAASVKDVSEERAKKLKERRAKLAVKDYVEVEVLNKESKKMEKKKQNLFIARQSQKYAAIIWQHILSEKQKT